MQRVTTGDDERNAELNEKRATCTSYVTVRRRGHIRRAKRELVNAREVFYRDKTSTYTRADASNGESI